VHIYITDLVFQVTEIRSFCGKGSNHVCISPSYMRMETDLIPKMCGFRMLDNGQCPESQ
jgi:hypothetical protein